MIKKNVILSKELTTGDLIIITHSNIIHDIGFVLKTTNTRVFINWMKEKTGFYGLGGELHILHVTDKFDASEVADNVSYYIQKVLK